jgi:hypothetical protein
MGDARTMHITDETVRTDHEIGAEAGRCVRSLRQIFPAWVCWYGAGTRSWWALPPTVHRYPGLVEAATAEELAQRIQQVSAAERKAVSGEDRGIPKSTSGRCRQIAYTQHGCSTTG